jgi:hypothetical protein
VLSASLPSLFANWQRQNGLVLLQVSLAVDRSQRSADISQCAEDMDKTARKWGTEETCELLFVFDSLLISFKNAFCFVFSFLLIFLMRGI